MMFSATLLTVFAIGLGQQGSSGGLAQQVFMSVDLDQDGGISLKEFNILAPKFDLNGDGTVTEAEFVAVWMGPLPASHAGDKHHEDAGKRLFTAVDSDKDGSWSSANVQAAFAYFDTDGDHSVTSKEFLAVWCSLHDHTSSSGHAGTHCN